MMSSERIGRFGERYRPIRIRGTGTFAEVWECEDTRTGDRVACKRMKQTFENPSDAENLREVIVLKKIQNHENILNLQNVVYENRLGKIFLVFELMEKNLYELIQCRRRYFAEIRVQHYTYQLCKALDFLHRAGFFHRDVKPENILIKGDLLKLGDFGSCRVVNSKHPYTEYISTRWYRPPECLLTQGYYNFKMDIWAAGCVFYEIVSKSTHVPFDFPVEFGIGIDALLPHCSSQMKDLIKKMCKYDPDDRITAREVMCHPYFKNYRRWRRKEFSTQEVTYDHGEGEDETISNQSKIGSREAINLELAPVQSKQLTRLRNQSRIRTVKECQRLSSKSSTSASARPSNSSSSIVLPSIPTRSLSQRPPTNAKSQSSQQPFLPHLPNKPFK